MYSMPDNVSTVCSRTICVSETVNSCAFEWCVGRVKIPRLTSFAAPEIQRPETKPDSILLTCPCVASLDSTNCSPDLSRMCNAYIDVVQL